MAIEGPNSMARYYGNPHFDSIYTSIWKIILVKSLYRRQKKKSKKVGSYRTGPNHFSDWGVFDNSGAPFHRLSNDAEPVIFHGLAFS